MKMQASNADKVLIESVIVNKKPLKARTLVIIPQRYCNR